MKGLHKEYIFFYIITEANQILILIKFLFNLNLI